MREKRKPRKLAEKIESRHGDAVMRNRRIVGLTPTFACSSRTPLWFSTLDGEY